jgi:hypothetical protein
MNSNIQTNSTSYKDFEEGFRLQLYLQGMENQEGLEKASNMAWDMLRGAGNAFTAVPRFVKETVKSQITKNAPIQRVGGYFSTARELTKGLREAAGPNASDSAKRVVLENLRKAKKLKKSQGMFSKARVGNVEIGRLGNVYHHAAPGSAQAAERTVHGILPMAREAVAQPTGQNSLPWVGKWRPSLGGWQKGFETAFPKSQGINIPFRENPIDLGARSPWAQRAMGMVNANAMYLPFVGYEAYQAETPADYRDVAIKSIPGMLIGSVAHSLGGKRYGGIVPMMAAYGGGEAIASMNPLLRRPYNLSKEQMQGLADQYGISRAQVYSHLAKQEAEERKRAR